MVLDGAATDASEESIRGNSSPSIDADFASGNVTDPKTLRPWKISIDTKEFPWIPAPLALFTGYSRERVGIGSVITVCNMAKTVRRPLTDEEAQAVAYHYAKGVAFSGFGLPVGVAMGVGRWAQTRSTFKFPFWQPDMQRLNIYRFGPITGPSAPYLWHGLRGVSYAAMGTFFGKLFISAYAVHVAVTGQRLDKRLKDMIEDLRRLRASRKSGDANTQGRFEIHAAGEAYGFSDDISPEELAARLNTSTKMGVDDSGFIRVAAAVRESDPSEVAAAGAVSRPGPPEHLPDQETYRYQTPQPYAPSAEPVSEPARFDFDDASPTAGNASVSKGPEQSSAWERLRRGGPPPTTARQPSSSPQNNSSIDAWAGRRQENPRMEERDKSSTGESFSYSSFDAEKQQAKQEAQKEFDERIERERRGENFEDDGKWR